MPFQVNKGFRGAPKAAAALKPAPTVDLPVFSSPVQDFRASRAVPPVDAAQSCHTIGAWLRRGIIPDDPCWIRLGTKKRPGGRPPAVGKSKHQPFEKIQLAHWITDQSR
ncbi:hypothetical protein GCM10007856_35630 [Azospirillum oryzae]|nr:hypothetical protein GCM10007856_35630 [Azospirillum oryzae]